MTRGSPLYPEQKRRHRVYRGLSERQERIFAWLASGVILLVISGWVGSIAVLRKQQMAEGTEGTIGAPPLSPTRAITSAVFDSQAPKAAYINDAMLAFLGPLRGESGTLRFATRTPGSPIAPGAPAGSTAVLTGPGNQAVKTGFAAPQNPGIYKLAVQLERATRPIEEFNLITLVPISRKREGKIGLYYLGSWPWESGGKPRAPSYAPPAGFIEVTRENQDTYVSKHFRLRDFLTKDQANVWPKYLLLNPKMIDKLELAIVELQARGIRVEHVQVMSGFRTPRYNHGGGNTAGRANLSRHMYGDACDVFVDNDRNGMMDDLNRDGRVNAADADVLGKAVETVERKYPSLVGGVGVYSACCGHGPFTHVDVRGFRARWRGEGNG